MPGLIEHAAALVTRALDPESKGIVHRVRRRQWLADAADALDRAHNLDHAMGGGLRREEIDRERGRLGAVALDAFGSPHKGLAVAFPMTPGERALDVSSIDHFRTGPTERAAVADLLARVTCGTEEKNPVTGLLKQGAAEAHAWWLALENGHPGFAALHLAPLMRAMEQRFAAAAELVKREQERPVCVVLFQKDPRYEGPVMHGAQGFGQGARMVSAHWAPDPAVMVERLNEAINEHSFTVPK